MSVPPTEPPSARTDGGTERRTTPRTWEPPTAFGSRTRTWLVYGIVALFLLWSLWEIRFSPARMLAGLENTVNLVSSMYPPDFGPDKREIIVTDTIETLAMAVVATAVGVLISIPIALMAAENLAPRPVYYVGRAIVSVSRAFHSLIVAIVVVKAVGFGPLAGVITLSFATVGFYAKLLAEDLEDIDHTQVQAVQATGASKPLVLLYGVLPQVIPRMIALTIYRWDVNLRSSTIVGIVGAGGIGLTLLNSFQRYDYDFSLAIILVIVALVLLGELVSAVVRKRVQEGSNRGLTTELERLEEPTTWRRFDARERLVRVATALLVLAIVAVSWRGLEMNFAYVGTAGAEMMDLFTRMYPPDAGTSVEIVGPLLQSIHVSILGTMLAVVLSLPVAYIAAENTAPNRLFLALGKFIIATTRSVNVIVWVLVLVVLLGPGALAGVIALGVRSVGFIGKLLAEEIEEIDMSQVEAIVATGGGTVAAIVYGIVPQVKPGFVGITTYRWDINVRASTVIGFVGGGGIGVELMSAVNSFRWSAALTVLLAILGVVVASELLSAVLRKRAM